MSLGVGARLGHYAVTTKIGEGGMGEVWQATDTKLNRQVALKILPEAFATDPDRLARFQREAQVLASLNHPNIGGIYGLEEAEGHKALVLELVEGPTLADRIKQGPIPVDEALPIAKQIAGSPVCGLFCRALVFRKVRTESMGLRDLFGKKGKDKDRDAEPDPIADLVLGKLKVGYLVDYDLKTWEVTGYCRYEFDGNIVKEWEITAGGREKRYLELADGRWSLAKKIVIGAIDGDIRRDILRDEDPPSQIAHKGKQYYLDNSSAGHMFPNGEGAGNEVIRWEFLDEDEESFLGIEQWSESELGAATGFFVEDYEFTSILPGAGTD